ncbi:MAG TPA: CHAT domain-containing protein, partial [Bryobacteraceae bacterium]
ELVWFPQAGLGALPIHAAWTPLENGGRHWILEDYAIRYAPSVRALLRTAAESKPTQALVVSDPRGDLKFAVFECAWIRAALPSSVHATVLEGSAATAEEVLKALPKASLAHFTTHALFDLKDPFESALILAHAQRITLDTLLPLLRESPPAMVVLSACESAQSRVTGIVDEMLGFPAAFLENGTRTVIATLWEVEDSSASILIGRLYEELLKLGKSPAQALRAAQNWLRRLTVGELETLLKDLKNTDCGPAGSLAAKVKAPLRALDPALPAYTHPFYWAAFTASGH